MQTIQWQDADAWFEEENEPCDSHSPPDGLMVVEEKEDLQAYQLNKYADPAKDENRQAIITIIEKFASLLKNGQIHQIAQELLTEDVEMFIFNSSSLQDVQTADLPEGFINLFQNVQVKERLVRETHVDAEKQTVCQISNCLVMYGTESDPCEELAFEIFSIRDGRISKYRACFGRPCLEMSPSNDPLEPIKREKMLAKVKEINYALAGLPDFEKVAALLYETAEYKIWRWDDFKYFAFYKNEFATAFESLQENMSIKCVIPYDLGVDEQTKFVTGSYVYQLENNATGEKYDWISTCIYEFDGNINISRVSQQGELYPRGDIDIPFEVHTRQKLETKLAGLYSTDFMNLDKLYSDDILYDCPFWTLCFACKGSGGCIQGLKQVDKFVSKAATFKDVHVEFAQPVDMFVDHHHKGYDVAFSLNCYQGSGFGTLMAEKEERFNVIKMSRLCFENGKLAKSLQLISSLKKQIKSPFDDKSFKCMNIKG